MGRRGPKPKWAEDSNREPVIGLIHRADGRYSAHDQRNKTFGKNRDDAIRRFYSWKSQQLGETVTVNEIGPPSEPVRQDWENYADHHPDAEAKEYYRQALAQNETVKSKQIQDAAFWSTVAKRIRENPKLVARKTGIEEIGYLSNLKPPGPSIALQELLDLFLKKQVSADWKRQARLFWKEFRAIVKVTTAREITAEMIERYHDAMFDVREKKEKSPTFVKHRFGLIKSIFAFGLTRGRDQPEMRRVLDLCKMLVPPKSNGKNPQPISRDHFTQLLSVSDTKWTAIFLLSLNAALYPSEVAAAMKSEIDLDAKTLRMDRGKTGVHRVAILWDRTIDAIRQYQAEHPHDAENLFVSELSQPYNSNHIGRNFRRRRAEAGLPESIQFAHIRDGAETAAIEGGADLTQAKLLAGHRVGISDHYVRRNPKMVLGACKAIERHYFPEDTI